MALYKYNSTTNKLVPLTSEGSVGLPVGAVQAFAAGTTQDGWLECNGSTFDRTVYPALYTYLGNSNVLPTQFDHSVMSDWETFALPTVNTEMQYDGVLIAQMRASAVSSSDPTIWVNDLARVIVSINTGAGIYAVTVPFKKGDKLRFLADQYRTSCIAYYKQPLYIKATSAGPEVEPGIYATKGYIRDQNILSDYEDVTISQNSAYPTIMPYDGFLHVRYPGIAGGSGYIRGISVNGVASSISGQAAAADQYIYVPPVEFQKGDSVYLTSAQTPNRVKARYYKLRDYTGR